MSLCKTDGSNMSGRDCKKKNIVKSYKKYEVKENHDHPYPKGRWHIKKKKKDFYPLIT